MLHMYAMVFKYFSGIFATVSDACFKCFMCLFFCMLQLLHLDVSKVDRVLHMRCMWEAAGKQMTFGAAWVTSEAAWATLVAAWGPLLVRQREPNALGARSLPARAASGR
jgi:hypothetical protein